MKLKKIPILLLLLYAKKENSNHLTVVISIWLQTHSVNEQRQLISTHTKKIALALSHTRTVVVVVDDSQIKNKYIPHTYRQLQMKRWRKRRHTKHAYTEARIQTQSFSGKMLCESIPSRLSHIVYMYAHTRTHIHWLLCMCALRSSNRQCSKQRMNRKNNNNNTHQRIGWLVHLTVKIYVDDSI